MGNPGWQFNNKQITESWDSRKSFSIKNLFCGEPNIKENLF